MAQRIDALQVFIKTAAVGGIGLFWVNFTVKAFKMAWHIISTSPKEKPCEAVSGVMCEECQEYFIDDGEVLENGTVLCWTCQGY